MSATGRSDVRREDDFYETPAWCVERLLEAVDLPGGDPGGNWLEPCSGGDAILRAVHHHHPAASERFVRWHTVDIRPRPPWGIREPWWRVGHWTADFLTWQAPRTFDVAITNPPFSLAREFIDACLPIAAHVVMLLRLNFLASASRHDLFTATHPDVYVLPNRPSFTPDGRTDATEYCWMHWHARAAGIIRVLALTPAAERKVRHVAA